MAVDFILGDRDTPDWFPATVQEYLPEEHLARFVVEIVEQLDLRHLVSAPGAPAAHPRRQGAVRRAQVDRGDRFRHHQTRPGLAPMPAARPSRSPMALWSNQWRCRRHALPGSTSR
jgi:hypothetical protein